MNQHSFAGKFELFCLLVEKPGKVYTREEIFRKVWGTDVIVGNRTIEGIKWRLSNPYHNYRTVWVLGDIKTYVTYYVEAEKMVIFDLSVSNAQNSKKL